MNFLKFGEKPVRIITALSALKKIKDQILTAMEYGKN